MSSRRNPRPNGFKPPRVPSIQQPSASVRLPKVAGTYTPATLSEIWSVQEKADFNTCDRALRTAKKFACDLQRAAEIARETVAVSRTLIHHSQTGDHQSLDRGLALLDTMDDYHVEIADDVERMGDQIARLQVWFGAVREQVLASESVSNLPAPEDHRLSKLHALLMEARNELRNDLDVNQAEGAVRLGSLLPLDHRLTQALQTLGELDRLVCR